MTLQTYCAIIGHIDRSPQPDNRAEVQHRFESSLESINYEFETAIASGFVVTLGDEFQGVLKSPGESLRIVRRLQSLMKPVSFSFGVGIGSLKTPLRPVALDIEGEAFHRSQEALSIARDAAKGRVVYSFDGPALKLVNFLIYFADRRLAKVSPKTLRVHSLMNDKKLQADVARELGMTQQGISRAVLSEAFREVVEIEDSLHQFFESLQPTGPR